MTTRDESRRVALGLDFGTESVRAILVDLDGDEVGLASHGYANGQILDVLPTGERLPALCALQDPDDWMASATTAVREALHCSGLDASSIVGIGVDFTSCTMLPTFADGTPLCKSAAFRKSAHAWPKLWKHHGAQEQADRLTLVATQREESFLRRYGGKIGLEWFFPKALEVLDEAPEVYEAADVWVEAGDWFVWQLIGSSLPDLPRSTCQAGYKAMWSAEEGYPSAEYLEAVRPRLGDVVRSKMPGRLAAPGERVGGLTPSVADRLGLVAGTPVSAATIDAHAGVPGVGAGREGVLVMVMGTSSCHMLNATTNSYVPGVAGVVKGGILPGYYGYETGQAAVGDAFDWLRGVLGHEGHDELAAAASKIAPGSDGVVCLDWMNGCRTPLMDGSVSGGFVGLKLQHGAAHMYRALLEASAFGVRWIVETLEDSGVRVESYVATGGLPHHNRDLLKIYADVLQAPISVHPSKQGPALGAAVLGAMAAGSEATGFSTPQAAIEAMAAPRQDLAERMAVDIQPDAENREAYDAGYAHYKNFAQFSARGDET